MLENTSLVLLTVCINYISTEYTIYEDGWTPVARDHVYNQIRKSWKQNYIYSTERNAENTEVLDQLHQKSLKSLFPVLLKNGTNINDGNTNNITESLRKAKKMIDANIQDDIEFIDNTNTKKDINISNKNIHDQITSTIDRSNTYEVTEDTYSVQDIEQDDSGEVIGYDYTPSIAETKNLSSIFINILSKYNIKADDKLQNYDFSRRVKIPNPIINYSNFYPYRYNSLNHLLVDPLLAVFLSNYGFYLPNLYGIKSNYNNLYGYLASNNIHNNRPFGLYKIFSDTDSRI